MTGVVTEYGVGGVVRHTPDSYREANPTCANTDNDRMADNIRANGLLGLPDLYRQPENNREVVIVGGGPSVADQIADIGFHRRIGHRIVAINGMGRFLTEHSVPPDDLLMLDARPHMGRFLDGVPLTTHLLLASIMDPAVVKDAIARGYWVTLWHQGFEPGQFPELDGHEYTVVRSVANAAGLLAIPVMGLYGHRRAHLYGMESCYVAGKGHPYPQPENDGEVAIEMAIGGKSYLGALWMFWQAAAFAGVCQQVTSAWENFAIHVECPGLLRAIAEEMIRNAKAA